MTCIAGMVLRDEVVIGGDSLASSGWDCLVRSDDKVFEVDGGRFLMAGTGSYRAIQLARYGFSPPPHDENVDLYAYMVTAFIDALRERLKAGGFAIKDREQESGNTFLVASEGRLFRVDTDYQVGESSLGYDAAGSGQQAALGAMWVCAKFNHDPEQCVLDALRAATEFNNGVRGPYSIRRLKARQQI